MLWRIRTGGSASCLVVSMRVVSRISGFFFKSGKTKGEVDMRVSIKFLEFGDGLEDLGS